MSLYHAEHPDNLQLCLQSLYNQSLIPNQVVIVYDGVISEELDSVVSIWVKRLNIEVVKLAENVGLGRALNHGLAKCDYELIARMDTDDICEFNRFSEQVDCFKNDIDLVLCGTLISEFIDSENNIVSIRDVPLESSSIIETCCKQNPFNHMTVMYLKSYVEKAGGYQHLPWMEDWYLWLRMISKGFKCINISKPLVKARIGKDMIGRRSGINYIKSEWLITKIKIKLGLISSCQSYKIFIIRAFPRILPKPILQLIYSYSRRRGL